MTHFTMMKLLALASLFFTPILGQERNNDVYTFEYATDRSKRTYGMYDWDEVTCKNPGQCTGYTDDFPSSIGWNIKDKGNGCRWCPAEGNVNCGQHRQSPINVFRGAGEEGHVYEKECIDWHYMPYRNDSCTFDDMRDQFQIKRNGLYINTPIQSNGEIACKDDKGERWWPRIDYSKGFPHWWFLQYTTVVTPSAHKQEGKRYDAEVTLKHVYSKDFVREMGYVSIFMNAYDDVMPWPYLDKLICNWRLEEEKVRKACGLPPAEPYGRCELFRGQQATQEWLDEEDGFVPNMPTPAPTATPTNQPTRSPTATPTKAPTPAPSSAPSSAPSMEPTTILEAKANTVLPTVSNVPSDGPSLTPTGYPTASTAPSGSPSYNPTAGPTISPSSTPTEVLSASPTKVPTLQPSALPSSVPTEIVIPELVVCDEFGVDWKRFCDGERPCCGEREGESDYCESVYEDNLGDNYTTIQSACYHCCPGDEKHLIDWPQGAVGVEGGPPAIDCGYYDDLYNIDYHRMCEGTNPCCEPEPATSSFCSVFYDVFFPGDLMASACYYCCPLGPKEIPYTPSSEPTAASNAPSSAPSSSPTDFPSVSPSNMPSASPSSPVPTVTASDSPTISPTSTSTASPTSSPSSAPTMSPTSSEPAAIDCAAYGVDYNRMCYGNRPCCNDPRGDTSYCWDLYENVFPGNLIESACFHCCPGENKVVGPGNDIHPVHGKTIQCSDSSINPGRWCPDKPGTCCNDPMSMESSYCRDQVYSVFPRDTLEEVCYNCCHEEGSRILGNETSTRRNLRSRSQKESPDDLAVRKLTREERRQTLEREPVPIDASTLEGHDGKHMVMRQENFRELEMSEEEYFEQVKAEYDRRSLAGVIHEINYEDIDWSPYEWMVKVDTEYYYRYEGTQMIPPCREFVHWRVMKDPIKVHPRQIKELERLLAWRRSPQTCNVDTAGRLLDGGNRTRVIRDLQYFHWNQHRFTFCECKDWPSKFESDQQWCKNWEQDTSYNRFYKYPYNWCDKLEGCAY